MRVRVQGKSSLVPGTRLCCVVSLHDDSGDSPAWREGLSPSMAPPAGCRGHKHPTTNSLLFAARSRLPPTSPSLRSELREGFSRPASSSGVREPPPLCRPCALSQPGRHDSCFQRNPHGNQQAGLGRREPAPQKGREGEGCGLLQASGAIGHPIPTHSDCGEGAGRGPVWNVSSAGLWGSFRPCFLQSRSGH